MCTFKKPAWFKHYSALPIIWIGIAFIIICVSSSAWAQSTTPSDATAPTTTAPATTAPATTVPTAAPPTTTAPATTAPATTVPAAAPPTTTAPAQTAPAQTTPAQTAPAKVASKKAETLSELVPFTKNISGLADLSVSDVKTSGDVTSATVSLKGVDTAVVVYKIGKQDQMALIPGSFSFSNFIPGDAAGTLGKLAITNAIFLLKNGKDSVSVDTSKLPAQAATVFGDNAPTVTLKSGITFFGNLDVQNSGSIADLMTAVSVSDATIPLTGSLDPAVFSFDASSSGDDAKNAILDNLNIQAPLPTLAVSGLPDIVALKNNRFAIQGTRQGDQRSLGVGVRGELTAQVINGAVDFDMEVEYKKGEDTDLILKGTSSKKHPVDFFQTISLESMNFQTARTKSTWSTKVDAKSALHKKAIDVTIDLDNQNDLSVQILTKLTLTAFLGSSLSLPGLDDVQFSKIALKKDIAKFTGKIKGLDTELVAFSQGGKVNVAALFPTFAPDSFIPQVKGTVVDDTDFKNVSLVWVPQGSGATGVASSTLPKDIADFLEKTGKTSFDLKAGLNLFGSMNAQPGGKVADILGQIGITDLKLPLIGTLAPDVFKQGADPSAILNGLDLQAALPNLSIPNLPSIISLKNGHFGIKGKKEGGQSKIDVGIRGELVAQVLNKEINFDLDVEYKKGETTDLVVSGKSDKKFNLPYLKALELDSLQFNSSRTSSKWSTQLVSTSTTNNKPLNVTLNLNPDDKSAQILTKITLGDMFSAVSVPGLSDVEFDTIVLNKEVSSFKGKIKGLDTELVAFNQGGKVNVAALIATFEPSTFISPLQGTPADDTDFKNISLVWVPQGSGATGVASSALPKDVADFLEKSGKTSFDLKTGLNIYGKMEVHPSGQIGTLLKQVGVSDLSLPLSGKLNPAVFRKGAASGAIKNAILDDLDIKATIPNLSMPGLPKMITIKNGHFQIKSTKTGDKREIDVGIQGELQAKLGSEEIDFTFDIEAAKVAGSKADVTIKANSKSKVTLPFIQPLELDNMNLTATRTGSKWDAFINAKSKLNNKELDVTARKTAKGDDSVTINNKITLGDMFSAVRVPGLSDVEFDQIVINKEVSTFKGKLKGLATEVVAFKQGGKTNVAALFGEFTPSSFVAQLKGTPADDADFKNISLVWVPQGAGATGVASSALPKDIADFMEKTGKKSFDLKSGLNIYGNMELHPSGQIASILKKVGVSDLSLPLSGKLNPAVFRKGAASGAIKNAILDDLDIKATIPNLSMPGLPKMITIKNGHFQIKSTKTGDKREIDVGVNGELIAKLGSKEVDFTFDIEAAKAVGTKADIIIKADSVDKITLPFFNPLELDNMDLTATRTNSEWGITVKSTSKLNNKPINAVYLKEPKQSPVLAIQGILTLADFAPVSIPGLSDIALEGMSVNPENAELRLKVKGMPVSLTLFKRGPGNKTHVGITVHEFVIGKMIPGAGSTPLKDVDFVNATMLWVPSGSDETGVDISKFPPNLFSELDATGAGTTAQDLKAGLSLFSKVKLSGGVADMLKKVGINKDQFPLNGKLSPAVFKKGGGAQIKNAILDGLDIKANLPNLAIPGLPDMIKFKDGHFSIKGKNTGGTREIDVGISGEMDVKMGSKEVDFIFDIEMAKVAGAPADIKINADSEKTVTIPFFKPLELDTMVLTGTRSKGTWYVTVNAKSKLNNKPINLDYIKIGKQKPSIYITTKLTLADFAPISVPGLSDLELDRIGMYPDNVQLFGKLKGMPIELALFKRGAGNKTHVGLSINEFDIGKIIPGAGSTPLKDIDFIEPAMVWVPKGAAENDVVVSTMPYAVSRPLDLQGSPKQDLKEGLNLFATAKISGGAADMLSKVGIHKTQFPLKGKLDPAVFKKGSGQSIKNAILDGLDLKFNLPNLSVPGLPNAVSIKQGHFSIKGKKTGDTREIDVGVMGELIVKMGGSNIDFDFDFEVVKKGSSTTLSIKGETHPGTKATISMVETISLSDMSFSATKMGSAKWNWEIVGASKLHNKPITVAYFQNPIAHFNMVTKMTLAEAVGSPGLPGLDAIEFDWMEIWKDHMVMEMKIEGIKTDVEVFKPQGASKYNVALSTGDFSPDKFIPGTSNTPLKDVTFKKLGFLYNPGTARQAKHANMPFKIGSAVSGDINLKSGLNVFGHMDIHPTGTMADLLKKVGVNDLNLPLNGTFSPKAFSKNKASIKNTLLDALDVQVKLPTLSVPGMPKTVSIKHGHLAIKGKTKGGQREVDVGVTGELVAKLHGTDVDFEFDAEMKKTAGKPAELSITGHSEPGKKVTLNLIHPFHLDTLTFAMNKEKAGWKWQVDAKTTLHSKPLDVSYIHDPAKASGPDGPNHLAIHTKITVAEMIGQANLPGLDDIHVSWVEVYNKYFRASLGIKGTYFYVNIFKPQGASKHLVAVTLGPETISPDKFIPGTSNTPLKDVTFNGMSFVYAPSGSAGPLPRNQMPRDIAYRLRPAWIPGNITLKSGLNVFGKMEVHPSGEMATILKKVGVNDLTLPLNGGFSPKAFSKDLSAVKNALLDALDIKVNLPALSVPDLPGSITINHGHLAIKGKKTGNQREIDVGVTGELVAKMGSSNIDFDFDFEVIKQAGKPTKLSITGETHSGTTATLSMVETFHLSDLSFNAHKQGGAKWDWDVKGTSKLHNKPITLTYTHSPNGGNRLDIHTKMTLAQAVGSPGLPGLDDVEMDWIYLRRQFMKMQMKVKGVTTRAEIFKPQGASKYNVALSTGDFSPDKFIPGTSNTPLKDVTFKKLGFVYNPGAARQTKHADMPLGIGGSVTGDIHLKNGLNVFGHMDVHPTGEMASLLQKVGIHDLNLPLNGKFSPKAFKKDHASIKDEILEHLDINMKIPTPSIPGLSSIVAFHNGHLKVKGKLNKQGQRELDIAVSGDADVHIRSEKFAFFLNVERDKTASQTEIKINGHTDRKWTHPFGIHWLDLDKLTLDIDKKTKDGVTNWDIDVNAKADVGSHTHLDVSVDVHEKNGSVTDVYFELDGPIELSEIPEINRIPHADKYSITKIKASEHGVEARTIIGGRETDAFLFEGSGWNFAITQKHFAATEFLHALKDTPLKFIKFPFIAVMLSETGIHKNMSDLSIIAQDAFKEVLGAGDRVDIKPGLAFIAGFHPDSAGSMKDAVKGIGIHESVTIMGEIGGMFGGPPSVKLVGKLTPGPAHNMPKSMKAKTTEEVDFFLNVLESGQDFDFELGMAVGVHTTIKGDRLFFDTKVKVQIMDEGFGIDVEGQMKGLWHKPFGIPGFTMGDVTIEVGTQEDGAIKMGFAGTTILGGDKFKIAGDGEFLPEALGAPQAIAFKASADEIPMFFLEQIMLDMVAKEVHLDIPNGMLPVFKKVKFAFCTPGAEDPDLNITGEGFALSGGLSWLGHELGKIDVSLSPTKGIFAKGKIDDINLGPLHLKKNMFDMGVPLKALPHLKVHSDLAFLGIKERFLIEFNKSGIKLDAHSQFGPDFSADFDLTLSGVNLDVKKPEFKNADFAMSGDFKLDIGKFIAGPAKKDMDEIFDELDKNFKKAEADVKHWRSKVDGLNRKINAERAKVRRERAAAERRIQSAENRVNRLNGEVNNDWHHYHHCHGWGKWACRGYWGVRARAVQGARWVAEEALRAVEQLVDHFPIDLDPRIAILISAKDIAKAALTVALDAIEGADELERLLKEVGDKLLKPLQNKEVANLININSASFKGDLRGVIEHDTPVDLGLDAELFGLRLKENFAFKIKDLAYDLEQLGVMGLMALENLVGKGLGSISHALKSKFHSVVSRKIEAKQAAHKREMAKYGKDFTKYNKQAQAMQARLLALGAAELKVKLMENTSPLDTEGKSLTITNEYLEVGHTGLCLTSAGGAVTQHPCKGDEKAQQEWHTGDVGTGHGVPDGYVAIGQGGQYLVPEGQWVTVQKKIGGFTLPIQEFQGTGRLILAAYKSNKEHFWKILKHGDGWMYMANRATNKCLHFTDGDARPGKARAEWQPCIGSANQVFRIADRVTPEYHKANIALKNDGSNLCFGRKGENVSLNFCREAARYDYLIDIRGNIRFVNRATGKCLQPESYKKGSLIVERTCTQLDYQWWSPIDVPGGWMIKNAQTGWCTYAGQEWATQGICKSYSANIIAPVLDVESGTTLTWVQGKALPGGNKFDAAYTIQERIPEYTAQKHRQERAQIARYENDKRWAGSHEYWDRSYACRAALGYWASRARGWMANYFWRIFSEVARSPLCQYRREEPQWVKNRIRADDYQESVLRAKLRKNARPAPEPKWYLCVGEGPHGSRIPGVVENRKCVFNYNAKVHHDWNYILVVTGKDVEWKHGGGSGGHIPPNAIPMGYKQDPNGHLSTAYSCRTMINDKTRIGTTLDGRTCWYTHGNTWGGANNFEVLSRKPGAVYKLDLTN